ncbi:DUF2842 domain-containing protein [Devosia elaeis]|uniref:DUF2842 domain-containing protein n=1 Tax=Devosia elaeis TaxID=1770058 RepID=A0A178HQV8_9HYPH|nr:DUF2842 domain-containing protein [Devosia elaeis]OAM75231.1 hypothetical protein A3840_14900 [Devosia elaeis]
MEVTASFPVSVKLPEWYAALTYTATDQMPHMTQRNRKLIGAFLLVGSIVLWSVLATAIYLMLPEGLPGLVLIGFFIIAGMGWLLPAMAIIQWMARPDSAKG